MEGGWDGLRVSERGHRRSLQQQPQGLVFCVGQTISLEVDIMHYEWSNYVHGDAAAEHESLIR